MPENKKNKRIAFFTPNMNRTGSEIVLFNLLGKLGGQFKPVVIAKYRGVLLGLLPSYIKWKVLYKKPVKFNLPFKSYTLTKLSENYYSKTVFYIKTLMCRNALWYVNTIILPEVIEFAEKHRIKVIAHIHEREDFFERLSTADREKIIRYPFLIIANSKITAKVLSDYGRKDRIEICYPSIKTKDVIKDRSAYTNFRKKLGIGDDIFLWVMSGSMDENKNPYLFIDIAFEVLKTYPNALFMWIGATENELLEQCKRKAIGLGLEGKIIWIGNLGADYYNYFNCANGFVLTSLKESFSLVVLEALLLELPVVTSDCGGVREILEDDIGQIIKQQNTATLMAQAMVNYMSGKTTFNVYRGKQRAEKFDIEIVAAKWNQILTNYYN